MRSDGSLSFRRDLAVKFLRSKDPVKTQTAGEAWRVRRLELPPEAYYLVELGHPNAAMAVVDAGTGEINSYANLPGTVSHVTSTHQERLNWLEVEKPPTLN